MENEALYNFINDACKQDDSNLDISIATLQSAIGTLQKEVEKRKAQKRQHLIADFIKVYRALVDADVTIKYEFNTDYAYSEASDSDSYGCDSTTLEMDNSNCFIFE